MNHKNIIFYFIQIIFIICLISLTKASALDLSIESAIGYDDNTAKTFKKKGSAFGLYQIDIVQPFNFKLSDNKSLEASLFAQSVYNDYFRIKDNYYIDAGATFSLPIYKGQIIPGISSDLMVFRDNFFEKDSKNEITTKIFTKWLVSSQLTLVIKQSWQWSDYKELVEIQSESLSDNMLRNQDM